MSIESSISNGVEERKPIKQYSFGELRAICQKTAPNPARESIMGLLSRFFAIYFTKLFVRLGLNSHAVTILSVAAFFCGLATFYLGNYWFNLLGVLLMFISIVWDCCDGEVARFRQTAGLVGGSYTEPVSHDVQYGFGFIFLAVIMYYTQDYPAYYLILGAVAGISKLLYRSLELRFWNIAYGDASREQIQQIKQDYYKKPLLVRAFYWFNKNAFSSTAIFTILLLFTVIDKVYLYFWWFGVGYFVLYGLLFLKQVYLINVRNLK